MEGIEVNNPQGGAGSVGTLTVTELQTTIAGTTAGAWVTRTLSAGANTVVQIKVVSTSFGNRQVGVREIGSPQLFPDRLRGSTVIYTVTTDSSSNIQIYSSGSQISFLELNKLEVL
jgi:hypothetical protein